MLKKIAKQNEKYTSSTQNKFIDDNDSKYSKIYSFCSFVLCRF